MEVSQDFSRQARDLRIGTWAAILSYGMWGLFPVYWKQINHIDAVQILCHRVLWSALFLLIILRICGLTRQVIPIFKGKRSFISVAACAILITANWGTYIWAVNVGKVTEASLGYYITPLLSVALGGFFFKEKMDRWATVAVILSALGVAAAAIMIGELPLVSIVLAITFSVYGAAKKWAGLDALTGLAAETMIAAPFAAAWLIWINYGGWGNGGSWGGFFGPDIKSAIFLTVAGPVTAIPLLTFAYAAVRIPLQRIGFIQYFSPTIQLLIGLMLYDERLSTPMALAFAIVLAAVAIYLGTRKIV